MALPTRFARKVQSNRRCADCRGDVSPSDSAFATWFPARRWKSALTRSNPKNLQRLAADGISSLFSIANRQGKSRWFATQVQNWGCGQNNITDYQLLQAAKQQHKPVIELEGAENQITMLLQLPDKGLALLDDTLTHWHTNARLLQQMMSWWLNAPPQNNDITLPNTFSQSLYDVLMHQRNLAWRDKLRAMPPGRYVVAVGALHLYGEGNLPQMLR